MCAPAPPVPRALRPHTGPGLCSSTTIIIIITTMLISNAHCCCKHTPQAPRGMRGRTKAGITSSSTHGPGAPSTAARGWAGSRERSAERASPEPAASRAAFLWESALCWTLLGVGENGGSYQRAQAECRPHRERNLWYLWYHQHD